MAFTIAHMAAALPFYNRERINHSYRWVNFEAMMIGSIMPDLPYFIGNLLPNFGSLPVWDVSHRWIGLVSYCLPWGLFLYFLWIWWFKPAFFGLITPFMSSGIYAHETPSMANKKIRRRTESVGSKIMHWISWVLIPLSIGVVLGAVTHILWDATTHVDGFISERISFLQQYIPVYPIGTMKVARFLQFFTSIIGLLALLWFAITLFFKDFFTNPRNQIHKRSSAPFNPTYSFNKKQSLITLTVLVILIAIIGIREGIRFHSLLPSDIYGFMARFLISSMRKIAVLIVVYTLFYHLIVSSRRIKTKYAE